LLFATTVVKADCSRAYNEKAWGRADVMHTFKIAGTIGVIAGATAVGAIALAATGGTALVAIPVLGVAGLGLGFEFVPNVIDSETKKTNTYFQSLAVIEGAKRNVLTLEFLNRIDRKIKLYSYSLDEQKKIEDRIIKIILESNEKKLICRGNTRGKAKVLNLKGLTRYTVKQLDDFLINGLRINTQI